MTLSKERIADIASKLFWDEKVDQPALAAWLAGSGPLPEDLEKTRVYVRLLSSVKWYDLLDLLSRERWSDALSDATIARLFPPALKNQYRYVQSVLLK